MPRLLSRALFVLGGAAAATAAAWLVSSATASADTLPVAAPSHTFVAAPAGSTTGEFQTGLSTVASTVADPITSAGTNSLDAVTEPSQSAALPLSNALPSKLPADLPMSTSTPAGLAVLTSGLGRTVGQLSHRIPVRAPLPNQLIAQLGRGGMSIPSQHGTQVQSSATGQYRAPLEFPQTPSGQQTDLAGTTGDIDSQPIGSRPVVPATPGGSAPFGPLTFPAMPGSGTGNGGGSFVPTGFSLTAGDGYPVLPAPHVVDVLAPADVPAPVLPGKQPGITPD